MKYILQNKDSNYYKEIDNIINNKKEEIFSFFNSTKIDLNFNIYIYNTIEDLVLGLKNRGFMKDPDYMCACFKDEDNSLNFFEPKNNPSDLEWSKEEKKNVIFHELIHGIQFTLFGSTKEWLNEGIAKYLDKSYNVIDLINKIDFIPNQNEIENEFGKYDYDSYIYSFLMVSYLIEKLGKDEFINKIKNNNLNTNNLLNNSIDFYKNKYIKRR